MTPKLQAFCTNYGNLRHKALRHVSFNLLDPALFHLLPGLDNFTKVLSMNGVLVSIAAAYLCLNYLFKNFTKCTLASTITSPHAYIHCVNSAPRLQQCIRVCICLCCISSHVGCFSICVLISRHFQDKGYSIKRLTVPPWLELCGTCLLAELLYIVRDVLQSPSDQIFTWTDSTIELSLLRGNPRWFKTWPTVYDILPPDCWRHVDSSQNQWTVHSQVCTYLNFIIILYGGKDLIGWS